MKNGLDQSLHNINYRSFEVNKEELYLQMLKESKK